MGLRPQNTNFRGLFLTLPKNSLLIGAAITTHTFHNIFNTRFSKTSNKKAKTYSTITYSNVFPKFTYRPFFIFKIRMYHLNCALSQADNLFFTALSSTTNLF